MFPGTTTSSERPELTPIGWPSVEAITLDEIAVLDGTDKSSVEHDYVRQYERAFDRFRHMPIDVLEIGVANGASLRMWERYFSQARLVGVDIIPECVRHQGGRKVVKIGSQTDIAFLDMLIGKYSPSIIIDDGSHQADHIEITLKRLFPSLRPGGCYVIEDLNFHTKDEQGSQRPTGALKFALDIAFATTYSHPIGTPHIGLDRSFMENVDRVEFVRHAAFLWKKVPEQDSTRSMARMRELVEQSGSAQNWFFYIHYSLNRGGSLTDAEVAARKAIELDSKFALAHWRLSEILERRGDIPGALAAAEVAHALEPQIDEVKRRIERLKATQ